MNPGTRADHDQFCRNEGWELVRDARGRAVAHHVTYELALNDGSILRTRISRPVNKKAYGVHLWKAILREQLVVTEDEFWACVNDRVLPDRGQADQTVPDEALPASLVHQLIHVARVPEDVVKTMSLEQAVARMTEHWSHPPA